jgi:hypothetical protein
MVILASLTIPLKHGNLEIILRIAVPILGIFTIYLGYDHIIIQKITIDEVGLEYKKGRKIVISRSWYEIKTIKTRETHTGDFWYIDIFFIDDDKFEMDSDTWGVKQLKSIFNNFISYQEKFRFQVKDELNWRT